MDNKPLVRIVKQYLMDECYFELPTGEKDAANTYIFFKNNKQVNIVEKDPDYDNLPVVTLFLYNNLVGKFSVVEVLSENNLLLNYFLKT